MTFKVGDKVKVKPYDQWPYKYATNRETITKDYQGKEFVIKATGMTGDGGQYNHNKKHRWYKFVEGSGGVYFTADHLEKVEMNYLPKELFEL